MFNRSHRIRSHASKGKDRRMNVSVGMGLQGGPISASYNAKSGSRINRRAGFDQLFACRTASAVVRFRTE
jgi:hypothetical protein